MLGSISNKGILKRPRLTTLTLEAFEVEFTFVRKEVDTIGPHMGML